MFGLSLRKEGKLREAELAMEHRLETRRYLLRALDIHHDVCTECLGVGKRYNVVWGANLACPTCKGFGEVPRIGPKVTFVKQPLPEGVDPPLNLGKILGHQMKYVFGGPPVSNEAIKDMQVGHIVHDEYWEDYFASRYPDLKINPHIYNPEPDFDISEWFEAQPRISMTPEEVAIDHMRHYVGVEDILFEARKDFTPDEWNPEAVSLLTGWAADALGLPKPPQLRCIFCGPFDGPSDAHIQTPEHREMMHAWRVNRDAYYKED